MTSGITCQFCESAPAEVLMTWLSNGASITACPDDLAPGLIHVLAVDLGVDPGPFYEHVRRYVDKQAKLQAAAAAKGTSDGDSPGRAPDAGEPTPPGGTMGAGQVASDDGESLVLADEGGQP